MEPGAGSMLLSIVAHRLLFQATPLGVGDKLFSAGLFPPRGCDLGQNFGGVSSRVTQAVTRNQLPDELTRWKLNELLALCGSQLSPQPPPRHPQSSSSTTSPRLLPPAPRNGLRQPRHRPPRRRPARPHALRGRRAPGHRGRRARRRRLPDEADQHVAPPRHWLLQGRLAHPRPRPPRRLSLSRDRAR